MSNHAENASYQAFRRGFRGYKRKEVDEYISYMMHERTVVEDNYRARIELLVRENEQAANLLRTLQDDKVRLLADNGECKRQLKEQGETIQTLYERLDLLGSEMERLQNKLAELKKSIRDEAPSNEEWRERALAAEETVRHMAENEWKENKAHDGAQHFRVPIGKKAYLDLTFRKDDKSI